MSFMGQEAAEAPEAVARFLSRNGPALEDIGARLRRKTPPVIITSARGSSDNAAGYFKYLSEILLGVPCCSMGASVVSVYGAKLKCDGALCVTISQSGMSPDIAALQEAARGAGAFTVAVTNAEASPVAKAADICLPLHAGAEKSIAATKTFIASLVAGAAIVAHWLNRQDMLGAIAALPEVLSRAAVLDWREAVELAEEAESLYVVGRGPSFPIAAETALKLKETCGVHAEAYSLAEVMHGPLELLGDGFPVIAYSPDDAARAASIEAIAKLRSTGAKVLAVGQGGLDFARTGFPLLDPISIVQSAYRFVEETAKRRGRDPDRPRLLKKVTETL